MFAGICLLYWFIELCAPIYFAEREYALFIPYIIQIQHCLFAALAVDYTLRPIRKHKNLLLVLALHTLYIGFSSLGFPFVPESLYALETAIWFSFFIWVMHRPQKTYTPDYDEQNILLGFYVGEKGSLIMNFFELLGLPVKSVCIIVGDECLRLRKNSETFIITSSKGVLRSNDYLIVDTRTRHTTEFLAEMRRYVTIQARKNGLRTRCIEAVRPLLIKIGKEWDPVDFWDTVPSIYFKRRAERLG